jgi:ribosomal-protein-alanine N-acetyltransferase
MEGAHALVGFVCLLVVAGEAQLENMAVNPAHQRRGLGRLLLQAALQASQCFAVQGGCPCLLEVQAQNEPAIALYHSMGFKVSSCLP